MSKNSMRMQRDSGWGRGGGNGPWMMITLMVLWLGFGLDLLPLVAAGSCREAQLCCNGRDSSCVVQKAPVNAIIEDLSDKPCYCDHACLKLGDCCDDFKDHCGVLDCQVGDWGAWSECDKICGTGMMTRTRQILQAAQNGGKHCPSMLQKRGCQGYRCHGHRDKKILREMALLLPAALTHSHNRVNETVKNEQRHNLRTRYRDTFKHIRDHEYCVEFEVIKSSKACHKLPPYNLMLEGDRITVRCDLEALVQDNKDSTAGGATGGAIKATTTTTTTHKSYLNADEEVGGGLGQGDEINSNNNNNNGDNDNEDDEEQEEEEEEEEEEKEQEPEQDPEQDDEEEEEDDDEETNDEEDAQNMLDTETDAETAIGMDSNESFEYTKRQQLRQSHHRQRSATSKRSTNNNNNNNKAQLALQQQQQQQLLMSHHCRGEGLSGRTTRWSALPAPSCRGKWLRLTIGPPKKCNHAQFIFV